MYENVTVVLEPSNSGQVTYVAERCLAKKFHMLVD